MTKKFPSIQVINRAASLLDAITRDELPVSLKVLAAHTGLHPATAFRILGALAGNGLTERDERGRYRIGTQFSAINARADLGIEFRSATQVAMQTAHVESGCEVSLGTRDRDLLIPVQNTTKAQESTTADKPQGFIKGALLHHCGGGRLILATAGRHNFERYIRRARCYEESNDISSVSQVDALWAKILKEHEQGYATDLSSMPLSQTFSVIVDPEDTWRSLTISLTHLGEPVSAHDDAKVLVHLRNLAQQVAQIDRQNNDLRSNYSPINASEGDPVPTEVATSKGPGQDLTNDEPHLSSNA